MKPLPAFAMDFMCGAEEISAAHTAVGISGCLYLFSSAFLICGRAKRHPWKWSEEQL